MCASHVPSKTFDQSIVVAVGANPDFSLPSKVRVLISEHVETSTGFTLELFSGRFFFANSVGNPFDYPKTPIKVPKLLLPEARAWGRAHRRSYK
jgi:hypothetical protein